MTYIGGEYHQNDWVISRDGKEVGRVMLRNSYHNGDRPREWSSWEPPAVNGDADTMEDALEKVRQAVLTASP